MTTKCVIDDVDTIINIYIVIKIKFCKKGGTVQTRQRS